MDDRPDDSTASAARERNGHVVLRQWVDTAGSRLRFDDSADYLVDPFAERVECRVAGDDLENVRHLLIDQVLPRVLAAHGHFVLHAGAVRWRDQAVLFAGDSGFGKSTLAAHFARHTMSFLGDDCFVVTGDGPAITVQATYRSLRLLPDSLTTVHDPELESAVTVDNDKVRVTQPAPARSDPPLPIAALLMLNDPDVDPAGVTSIQPLGQREAAISLLRNSFRLDVTSPHSMTDSLEQAAGLAAVLPIHSLSYPRDYDALGNVTAAIESLLSEIC